MKTPLHKHVVLWKPFTLALLVLGLLVSSSYKQTRHPFLTDHDQFSENVKLKSLFVPLDNYPTLSHWTESLQGQFHNATNFVFKNLHATACILLFREVNQNTQGTRSKDYILKLVYPFQSFP